MLENDPVSVRVLEGPATRIPVRVEGRHGPESGGRHAFAGRPPLARVRNIEDQQILRRWGRRDWVLATSRALEVHAATGDTDHHAIEPGMVFERSQYLGPETAAVHVDRSQQIGNGPRNAKVMRHQSHCGETLPA